MRALEQWQEIRGQYRKPHTDIANAERLVTFHEHELKFCRPWRSWLVWDGRRWARDELGRVGEMAKNVALRIYDEISRAYTEEERKSLASFAMRSESEQRIKAMIQLAKSDPLISVHPSQFDDDPWLLNVGNGVLDLRTRKLLKHDSRKLITKLAPVDFVPEARHPALDKLLSLLPVPVRDCVQVACGMSLTGDTIEELLFLAHGPTWSGKSTLLGALANAMGDYAATTNVASFLKQTREDRNAHTTDLANLAGVRMAIAMEVEKDARLAIARLKHVTGGDRIRVRRAYEDEFEYRPQFKLWLVVNDLPRADSDDGAFWRRVVTIPFSRALGKEERDPSLKETLLHDEEAQRAVLAWAVEGCRKWLASGRQILIPEPVELAGHAYRNECDELEGFFAERCAFAADLSEKAADLLRACGEWCRDNGVAIPSGNQLASGLRRRGCKGRKIRGARGWQGVGLRIDEGLGEDGEDGEDT